MLRTARVVDEMPAWPKSGVPPNKSDLSVTKLAQQRFIRYTNTQILNNQQISKSTSIKRKCPDSRPLGSSCWLVDLPLEAVPAGSRTMRYIPAALASLARARFTEDFHCEQNWTTPQQTWSGPRLLDVLDLAEPLPAA
jgi:hypothetical protein